MYSWGDSTSDWRRAGAYRFDKSRGAAMSDDARKAGAAGPRTYHGRSAPVVELTDPKKHISTKTKNPLIVATDVTGSMANWPFEIFDRLPLMYQSLSQYRTDLEISFAAIGDAGCDQYPLQVCDFAKGFALEGYLKALYGEGGGGDAPESYGLFAYYVKNHVRIPELEEKPFLIVFGDITMHKTVPPNQIRKVIGDKTVTGADAIQTWRDVTRTWNVWFLRREGTRDDEIDKQWGEAIGCQKIIHIHDEQRAVDYAMGLIARHWGRFEDFQLNMAARQDESEVEQLASNLVTEEA